MRHPNDTLAQWLYTIIHNLMEKQRKNGFRGVNFIRFSLRFENIYFVKFENFQSINMSI